MSSDFRSKCCNTSVIYSIEEGNPIYRCSKCNMPCSVDDIQIGGNHYMSKSIQPFDVMESWMSKEEFTGFLRGNIIKYLARYKEKGGVEDLKKAQHYLQKLISVELNRR